jgi:hypothetical protein
MRVSEVYSGEIMCVKPNAFAKDLKLMMQCTINGYLKQCMIRFLEIFSGEMICVKPNSFAKDPELMMECTMNGYPKQCMIRLP